MTDDKVKDYTLRISQANAGQLTEIIYELALDSLSDALRADEVGDTAGFEAAASKAERYVGELIHGLNYQDSVARQIGDRYIDMHSELQKAVYRHDDQLIRKVARGLEDMLPAFKRIAGEDKSAPLMENTQKVYAGLTYGKDSLAETSLDTDTDRGYTV